MVEDLVVGVQRGHAHDEATLIEQCVARPVATLHWQLVGQARCGNKLTGTSCEIDVRVSVVNRHPSDGHFVLQHILGRIVLKRLSHLEWRGGRGQTVISQYRRDSIEPTRILSEALARVVVRRVIASTKPSYIDVGVHTGIRPVNAVIRAVDAVHEQERKLAALARCDGSGLGLDGQNTQGTYDAFTRPRHAVARNRQQRCREQQYSECRRTSHVKTPL